jgi:hypothetical protein
VLDGFETRLEEIVNTCTNITREYWKNQKGISARLRRTELFQSQICRNRRKAKNLGQENFGFREGNFKFKVLFFLRSRITMHLGYQFDGREWKEALLYSMVSNSDLFGTGIFD